MHSKQRKQFEMLVRVREFGNAHRDVFTTSPVAQEMFAAVGTAVAELTATDMKKMSTSVSARADRKAASRRALIDLLQKAGQLVRVLRAEGRTMPPFEVPESKSDQALLTAGRQLAVEAAAFDAEFSGHGMGAAHIADVTTAFETAATDRGMNRADHVAAGTRIHDLLTAAMRHVRRLDLIVTNERAHDNVVQTVWKQARRLQDPRVARSGSEAEPTTPASGVDTQKPEAA
jgi:hypothetical protein